MAKLDDAVTAKLAEDLLTPARVGNLLAKLMERQTARETVECEFNVDRMVKQTANLYREVLDPRPLPV